MSAPQKRTPRGGRGASAEGTGDATIPPASDAERKRRATCIALLALHAHIVQELSGGAFLVSWRGCLAHCRDLAELEALARGVGAMR